MKNTLCYLILVLIFIKPLSAQQVADTTIDDYYIDFSVPDLGAFTLLNTKPDNITTPGSTKEFAASLLNIVSGGSTISPGLAIDWAPVKTFCKTTSPQEYKNSYLLRNLQFTFGTVGDSAGTKLGAGIKWTFIDRTDPLLDDGYAAVLTGLHQDAFVKIATAKNIFERDRGIFLRRIADNRNLNTSSESFHNILRLFDEDDTATICKRELMVNYNIAIDSINNFIKNNSSTPNDTLNSEEKGTLLHFCFELKNLCSGSEQYNKNVTTDFERVKRKWLNEHWNATVLTFGAGWVGNSSDGKWNSLYTQIFKAYLNGKFKISKKSQAIGIVTYSIPQNNSTTDSTIISKMFIGSRFLVGNASNRFSLDLGYGNDFAKISSFDKQTITADIGVEFKLNDGIFLEIAGGFMGEPSNFIKNSNILALGSLKYALHPKTRFNLPE